MKSDIQIAQEAVMEPIAEVAKRLDIREDELELYGKYKAKFSDELLERLKDEPDGKLVLVTAINPTPAGEGKTTTSVGLRTGIWKTWKKSSHCVKRTIFRTMLWYQRRCGRRRICPGGTNGRSEFTFYRRFPCDHFRK